MTNKQTLCNPDTALRFLTDRLGEDEQRTFEQHLDSCDACRRALHELAAADDWWQEAQSYLGSDAALGAPDGASLAGAAGAKNGTATDDRPWSLDFLAPTDDPRMLGRFGGYEISGVIGRGGMGLVLKGFDAALNRYVAIKVLAPHLAASGGARRRFAREAQAAAAVVHENVIAIHGVSEERGLPYLVMPYFRGTSLQKRLDAQGPLATCEVLRIGMQAAAGLAAAHAQGLVHRDIKPANILLAGSVERVKITDFGLARAADDASLTHSGIIAGTPQYMSPEQARGEPVDARSDLFSLGSVLYAAVTGRPPFRAETSYGVLKRITDTEPRPIREHSPETPEWLCRIIAKLHAKTIEDRFQSAAEVAEVMEECLAHAQNAANPLPAWLADKRATRKLWLRWSAAAAIVVATVAGVLAATGIPTSSPRGSNALEGGCSVTTGQPGEALDAAWTDPSETLWEDGTVGAIDEVHSSVLELDARSRKLWDTDFDNSNS